MTRIKMILTDTFRVRSTAEFENMRKLLISAPALIFGVCLMTSMVEADESQLVAGRVSLMGTLQVQWGDPVPLDADRTPQKRYTLQHESGRVFELFFNEEKLTELEGRTLRAGMAITVSGELSEPKDDWIWVDSVSFPMAEVEGDRPRGVYGEKVYATIACRFADSTGTTPRPMSFFEDLMGSTGMNHYWDELSYGYISIDGSTVEGWYNLPHNRSHYVYDMDGDGDVDADLEALAIDCTAEAEADIYFPDHDGILMMFNEVLDCCAWGGGITLNLDGQSKGYRAGWFPPAGFNRQDVVGHEMGHSLGLPHSSGPYGATYDSHWDVMSSGGACRNPHPTYGCIGIHTISYHKDMLGWIDSDQRYEPDMYVPGTIPLQRLAPPVFSGNYLMAKIPIGGSSTHFYTVETRLFVGYDEEVAAEAVVMHDVDTTRGSHALVVDPDGNGDPNDAGAQWLPGESFYDATNHITMFVEREISNGFEVSISRSARNPTYVDPDNGGFENGTSSYPWDTLYEGVVSVAPSGTLYVAPDNYPGTRTIRKPLTLRRDGSSGTVIIGE